MRKPINEIGNRYGRLVVVRRATQEEYPQGPGKPARWYCKCDCGKYTFADGRDLRNGRRKSCGCLSREKATKLAKNLGEKNRIDLTGQKFGKLTVISLNKDYIKGQGVKWDCSCECGAKTTVRSEYLLNGHTTSCGCNRMFGQGANSKGEAKIAKILKENNITFQREYTFKDLTYKGTLLRFDFAVFDKTGKLIWLGEVDGIQHFQYTEFFHKTQSNFKHMMENDRRKNRYALQNNIPLFRVPFYDIDNIRTLKDILQPQYRVRDIYHNDNIRFKLNN